MALVFPNNPTIGQTYQSGSSSTYKWTGQYWRDEKPSNPSPITANTASFSTFVTSSTYASSSASGGNAKQIGTCISGSVIVGDLSFTKADNPVLDWFVLQDYGDGWCDYEMAYAHTNRTGAQAGFSSGYQFELPSGYSFDTSIHPVDTASAVLSGWEKYHKIIPALSLIQADTYRDDGIWGIVPYTSNRFRILTRTPNSRNYIRNGNYTIDSLEMTYKVRFTFKKA